MIEFTVPIDPRPQPRPRFTRGRTYTPKDILTYKDTIRQAAVLAMAGRSSITGNVNVEMIFRRKFKISKRYGDIDNLCKGIFDALNGVVFVDDSQIVSLKARKVQSPVVGVDVKIFEE